MSTPQVWTGPDPEADPAPGVEFGSPGARLVAYLVDQLVQWGLTLVLILAAAIGFFEVTVADSLLIVLVASVVAAWLGWKLHLACD